MQFHNYLVPSIQSKLDRNHFPAEQLIQYFKKHETKESYYCLFDLEPRKDFIGYKGKHQCSLGSVVFDFDHEDLEVARLDVIKAYEYLELDQATAHIFFSGSKGFHLYVSAQYLGLDHAAHTTAKQCALIAEQLKGIAKTVDLSIYQANRKFRAPNSLHPKTNLYKTQISFEQLLGNSEELKEYAKTVREYSLAYSSNRRFGGFVVKNGQGNNAKASVTQVSTNYGLPDSIDNPFLKYAHKACIKAFETTKLDMGSRHTAARTLIAEYYNQGLSQDEALEKIHTYASLQGTLDRYETDMVRMVDDAYNNGKVYTTGCYDSLKKEYCSAQCGLYSKLDKNKRAQLPVEDGGGFPGGSLVTTTEQNVTKALSEITPFRNFEDSISLMEFPHPGSKVPKKTQENLEFLLETYGISARYNIIKKDINITIPNRHFLIDGEKNDKLTTIISLALQSNLAAQMIPEYIANLASKKENTKNPVKEWVYSRTWDGTDRLDSFYSTVTAEGEQDEKVRGFKNTLMLKWMCSALEAALGNRGVSAHGVLVFSGAQGIGKTAWFKSLVPQNLEITRDGMMLNPQDKDSVYQCVSNWLVELGEVDSTFRKADLAQLKAFLTKDRDILRLPYRREASEFIRRTVFFASVNDTNYLSDDTGNRRFWSIQCNSINYNHGLDMQQVWAQVESLRLGGLKWFLSEDELKQLNEHNRDFETLDPYEDRLADKVQVSDTESAEYIFMDYTQLAEKILINNPTRWDLIRLGSAVRKVFGVKSVQKKVGGLNRKGFYVKFKEPF